MGKRPRILWGLILLILLALVGVYQFINLAFDQLAVFFLALNPGLPSGQTNDQAPVQAADPPSFKPVTPDPPPAIDNSQVPAAAVQPEQPLAASKSVQSIPEPAPKKENTESSQTESLLIIEKYSAQISFQDKRLITKMVFSRLTHDDIMFLMGLLKNGFTAEEKQAAKDLALRRFTPEEIQEIKKLYAEYAHLLAK